MSGSLIWLHEDALRADHPVFRAAPADTPALFVWDDAYLRQMDYSLKRLVFIYESLCELPANIVRGDTLDVLRSVGAERILLPATLNPALREVAERLDSDQQVIIVEDTPFVLLAEERDFTRFAQYWKRAQASALLPNVGLDA